RLNLYFLANSSMFKNSRDKLLSTIQSLEGPALAYVEPFLSKIDTDDAPPMFTTYKTLITELTKVFGLPDKKETYVRKLDSLKQFGDIVTYVTLFRTYAAPLNWPEEPLLYHFKKGLSQATRDEMKRFPRTEALEETIDLAIEAYRSLQSARNERNHYQQSNYQYQRPQQSTYHPQQQENFPQPMDIDSVKSKPLTQEERDRRLRIGACFGC